MFPISLLFTFLGLILSGVARAVYTDQACVAACSDRSVVLGHFRGIYGNEPYRQNFTFANDFVNCCCSGEENDKSLGRDKSLASAGICQSCESTPWAVKDDLSAVNGSAENATLFKPQGYSTSEDRSKAPISAMGSWADPRIMTSLAAVLMSLLLSCVMMKLA
ncbi:uncharacterized protein MKK02DRAFT_29373 [Dioszegia hungarica]|uniref:Uncharacterized protein n=1 Tax=Dioszegia hungarica TaxID=4972 RepID=A0AA38HGS3_9TREE|nr:uncharacterized protein MKK02DRAFT_29373 [Dioszegia hungarica]KAI9639274.1 hypothetical protein MKK02DRAFT_29373 [Dioszegia hungarica]